MTKTQQKNVPKLRFPSFGNEQITGWQVRKFPEIFSFSTGKNIKQGEASPEHAIPCVRYGELYHLYSEVITEVFNKTNLPKSELVFSEGNEILLPSAGEDPLDIASASALTISGIAIGRTINVLKPLSEGVYSHTFASYYINSKLRKRISCLARGSSISNVYNSDLRTLKIKLPTLSEQRKIASFLGAVDTKIAQLTKKKRLLENYKKGCMQQLLNQKTRFKGDDGKDFPDWELFGAGELFRSVSNKNHKGDLPLLAITQEHGATLRDGLDKDIQVSAEGVKNYKIVEPDDFIISLRSFQGGIEHSSVLGICSPAYTILKPTRKIVPGFFKQIFKREQFISQLSATTIGIREGKQISFGAFATLKLPCPHPDEQQKIAGFLSILDRKIELVGQELGHARTFKQGLLQQMFV